jgi:predicted DNA-binding transcriptional regulator YafY
MLSSIRGRPTSSLWSDRSQAIVSEIAVAIQKKRRLRIVYTPPGETVSPLCTDVTPFCLTTAEERWYLVGRSSWHRKVHRFDLEHIQTAEQGDDAPESPPLTEQLPI